LVEPLSVTALAVLEVVLVPLVELLDDVWPPPPPPQASNDATRNKTAPRKQRESDERMVVWLGFSTAWHARRPLARRKCSSAGAA
jgi:hypothetical protein